jgi:hypothetical protein
MRNVAFICNISSWKPATRVQFKAWKKNNKVFGYTVKDKKISMKQWHKMLPGCEFYRVNVKDRLAIEQASKAERAESVEGLEIKQILAATRTVDNTDEQEQQVCIDAYLAYLRGMARNA